MSKLELFHDDITKDYIVNNKSLRYLEHHYGINRTIIKEYLANVGVEFKKHGKINHVVQSKLDDRVWMNETYQNLNSLQKLADVLNVSKGTVSRYIKLHEIPTNIKNYNHIKKVIVDIIPDFPPKLTYTSIKKHHKPRNSNLHDKQDLIEAYKLCRNIQVLADNHSVSYPTMQNALHYHNIPISSNNTSLGEQRIVSNIKSYCDLDLILNSKSIITGYELDIYIPEKSIAIEFNGLKWHDETTKGNTYHYDKYLSCKKLGITLIQVWEDDFIKSSDIIFKFIKYKLGYGGNKTFARKCVTVDVSNKIARDFHENHHIQGGCASTFSIGLSLSNKLVAVCSFKKIGMDLHLVRYSTSIQVIAGFSKILKYVDRNIVYENIITFADLCISDGNLYDITGFKKTKILKPDYKYIVDGVRKHKFGYRLKRFKNDSLLKYNKSMTERQLAKLNNIPRIYDAGKIKYIYSHNK